MRKTIGVEAYDLEEVWCFGENRDIDNDNNFKGFHDEDDLMSVPVRESILDRVLAQMPSKQRGRERELK